MTMESFGRTGWDEAPSMGGKSDFLDMKDNGEYVVRVIGDQPFKFAVHWTKDVNGKAKKVNCAIKDCALCKEGEAAKTRYAVEVFVKSTPKGELNECRLMEYGPAVQNHISGLAKNSRWGNPKGYDLAIVKNTNEASPMNVYRVMPLGKDPLLDTEVSTIKEFLGKDLPVSKWYGPSTNAEIMEKLGRQSTGAGNTVSLGSADATDDDDPDFGF